MKNIEKYNESKAALNAYNKLDLKKVPFDGKIGLVEVFLADGKWYAREGYEKFGENVAPYKDSEIEFTYCVCQIVRS